MAQVRSAVYCKAQSFNYRFTGLEILPINGKDCGDFTGTRTDIGANEFRWRTPIRRIHQFLAKHRAKYPESAHIAMRTSGDWERRRRRRHPLAAAGNTAAIPRCTYVERRAGGELSGDGLERWSASQCGGHIKAVTQLTGPLLCAIYRAAVAMALIRSSTEKRLALDEKSKAPPK